MKRILFALFAIALLTPFALQRDGQAQTTPMFTDNSAETVYLQAGSNGSTTAIALISPALQNGASAVCGISSARGVGGTGAVTHVTTGGTDLSSSFSSTASSSTCQTTYTGAASVSARVAASLTHIHLVITVGATAGSANASDTKNVTVKLVNLDTDKAALEALYDATGGASWTTNTDWKEATSALVHTYTVTVGQSGSRRGLWLSLAGSTTGPYTTTVTSGTCVGDTLPLAYAYRQSGTHYLQLNNNTNCNTAPANQQPWRGLFVRWGSRDFSGVGQINNQAISPSPVGGVGSTFEVQLRRAATAPGHWHGVTVTSGRVTGLALPNNNLTGVLPDALGELTALTTLNLSGNSGLTNGPLPGALSTLTALTTLNLGTTGLCSNPATQAWVDAITAKTGSSVTVTTCQGPQFALLAASFTQDAAATSASYDVTFTQNTLGATDVCSVAAAAANASTDPTDHDTTGTAITGFSASVSAATVCTITYTGTGVAYTAGTQEAVSITVNAGDGQGTDPDDTLDVTIKLLALETDAAALNTLYTDTAGASWRESAGWSGGVTAAALRAGTVHGVTVTDDRVTGLALPGNILAGTFPAAAFAELTQLAALDLSGNVGLTGTTAAVVGALGMDGLTTLDLRGTGICFGKDAAARSTAENDWLAAIIARDSGSGSAEVSDCGPRFIQDAATYLLDSGAPASTAIGINNGIDPSATYIPGALGTTACPPSGGSVIQNPSADPASFLRTGTAASGFSLTNSAALRACQLSYNSATTLTWSSGALEAVSVLVTINNGVDHAGATDTTADDEMEVTVKLVHNGTDKAALEAFHDGTGGSSWTTDTNWKGTALDTTDVWHGVTLGTTGTDADRVTALLLSTNNLVASSVPAELGEMTRLVALDLSFNPGLRGPIPEGWTRMASLSIITVRGTGLCADATNTRVMSWLAAVRAKPGSLVEVPLCQPRFAEAAIAYRLDAGEAGSTTPIDVGFPAFGTGLFAGAVTACTLDAAAVNASGDPAMHATTGTATTDFAVDAATCAITYTGAGATRTAGTLEAYSLTISIADGLDDETGPDDTINVTVRIMDAATDQAALLAFHTATGGASWTTGGTGGTGEWTGALAASWHGVTLTGGRVSGLSLNANNLSGNIPADLADLTKLTSLDLGGNGAGLRLMAPGTGLIELTGLTSLTLTGSGICEDRTLLPASPFALSLRNWMQALRANNGATVSVVDCAAGGPLFMTTAATYLLDAGSDGSSTPIVVGAPAFAAGTTGGTDNCRIRTQIETGDDETFQIGGATASVFTINTTTCALRYTGGASASARTAGMLEGWSVVVEVLDGVDGSGVADNVTDSSINVTVKLVNLDTDREVLRALYDATGGDSWTTDTNWFFNVTHTFALTPGALGAAYAGYDGTLTGSVRSGGTVTLGGTTYTLADALRYNNNQELLFALDPTTNAATNLAGLALRIGANTFAVSDAARTRSFGTEYQVVWADTPVLFADGVDVDVELGTITTLDSMWHGVTVGSGRVTALDLSNNNLAGALPASLWELNQLTSLDLGDNAGLTGMIPATIGELTGLTSLDLGGGALTGDVPALGTLTALTALDLSGNALTGTLEDAGVVSLMALTDLDLSGNGLTGEIPAGISALTALTDLDLSGNGLTGEIPAGVNALTALTSLNLGDNALTGAIPTLGALAAITSLDLGGNSGITGGVPAALGSLATLTALDLSGTALSGEIPAALAALTNLTSLDLRDTIVCVLVGTDTAVVNWLTTLRATATNTIEVANCDTSGANNRGPTFTPATAVVLYLDAGADGSTTAVAIATPAFVAGRVAEGVDTCRMSAQFVNASDDPAMHTETGTATTDFAVDRSTCAITYTGSGAARSASLAAYSLTITITDGVNDAGNPDRRPDSTLRATVKVLDASTDRAVLDALHAATGGSGWTATGWLPSRTIALTGAVNSGADAYGYFAGGHGSIRSGTATLVLSGTTYTLSGFRRDTGGPIELGISPQGTRSHLNGLTVTIDSTTLNVDDASEVTYTLSGGGRLFTWSASQVSPARTQADFTGSFDVTVKSPNLENGVSAPLSGRTGVTLGSSGVDNGRVTALDLSASGLTGGPLPDGMRELSRLTSLVLNQNSGLTGAIPAALGELSLLTTLDLAEGGWTGRIPAELGNLTALTNLFLNGNAGLTGRVPPELGRLPALTTLRLHNNPGMSGPIPPELGDLAALRQLTLYNAGVTGTIPVELNQLPAIEVLHLSDNAGLTGSIPPELDQLTTLTTLSLGGTGVCVDPARETRVETWLNSFRAAAGAGGALVPTCDGMPPEFARDRVTVNLDEGADGSTTPIALVMPAWTAGTLSGGATTSCRIDSARTTASDHPISFSFSGGADVATEFNVAGGTGTCDLTFTGPGTTVRTEGSLEATSVLVAVHDGVAASGALDTTSDDTIEVTVKLVNAATDKAALTALYTGANGSGWSTNTDWESAGAIASTWHGLTVTSGRATTLALVDNGLRGELPAALGDLSHLTSLDLSGNRGLRGRIPVELTRLTNLLTLNLADTRICSIRDADVRDWVAAIRAKTGGSVTLGTCPVGAIGPTSVPVTVSVGATGDAPAGARYGLQLSCGGTPFSISLAAGGAYTAQVPPDAVCSLSVTDPVGAQATRGEFAGRAAGSGILAIVTMAHEEAEPEPEAEDEAEEAAEPNPLLEATLVAGGSAFVRWTDAPTPVGEAVAALTLRVTAVHWWDAEAQQWRSWFPGGDELGVNTLEAFTAGGIYFVYAEEQAADAPADDDGDMPADDDGDAPAADDGDMPADDGDAPADDDDGDAPVADAMDAAAAARLDEQLAAGTAFTLWQGAATSVAGAVAALDSPVTAVHWWNAATQSWRSWFPGGDLFGVNTLSAFEPGDVYFIVVGEREG